MTSTYYIQGLEVERLWGHRDLKLTFYDDVNVLIGPNASGKTTILNLLRYILTADLLSLVEIDFNEVVVHLGSFDDRSIRTVRVTRTETGYTFIVSQKRFTIDLPPMPPDYVVSRARRGRMVSRYYRERGYRELEESVKRLVPAVWLPVSRRLPIAEEEEEFGRVRYPGLESVDVRLGTLLGELKHYRLGLDAQLSGRYKEFEKQVLQMILYSKEHDQVSSLPPAPLTQEEKTQLIRAFQEAGLLDTQMSKRIDEHFSEAEEVVSRLSAETQQEETRLTWRDIFIIPLIGRTKSIIQFARELEHDRDEIFAMLRKYEEIVNSFLEGKEISVDDKGELGIESLAPQQELTAYQLSSGEKQILILLTQALLWESRPIVYVVDEPELSLHVSWQEKLLKSLLELGRQIQIIVATHSPDVIGPFDDKVIDLGRRQ